MGRSEAFPPDGQRRLVWPLPLVTVWRAHTSLIPPQYACGTAQHECGWSPGYTTNEVDTEESGYVSRGIYQVADSEAAEVGMPGVDLLDLDTSTEVFVRLCTRRLREILQAAQIDPGGPLPEDVWGYLAISHVRGIGYTLGGIRDYGLSFSGFEARARAGGAHTTLSGKVERTGQAGQGWELKMAAYGRDCITGGTGWAAIEPAPTPAA